MACEWEAEAAVGREAEWWGAKGTQVMLRFQTDPALISKLTPFPQRPRPWCF